MSIFKKAWLFLKQREDKFCWECGGIIPSGSGGPYQANKLCDCDGGGYPVGGQ